MSTGRIDYSPDYKSEPELPDGWGLVEAFCADGHHRFLPDAPKCGCGAVLNQAVERARLERAVVEAAKQWHEMLLMHAGTTLSRKALLEAVDALVEFESLQEKKDNDRD